MDYSILNYYCTNGWIKSLWQSLYFYKIELYLPSIHYSQTLIQNNKAIIKMVLKIRSFSIYQKYIINIIHIKLQIFFISNLLDSALNRIKDCYWNRRRDKFIKSRFRQPQAEPDSSAIITWKLFLKHITNHDRVLLSPINTSSPFTAHRVSITSISSDNKVLVMEQENKKTYYEINSKQRKQYLEKVISPPSSLTFHSCESILKNNML